MNLGIARSCRPCHRALAAAGTNCALSIASPVVTKTSGTRVPAAIPVCFVGCMRHQQAGPSRAGATSLCCRLLLAACTSCPRPRTISLCPWQLTRSKAGSSHTWSLCWLLCLWGAQCGSSISPCRHDHICPGMACWPLHAATLHRHLSGWRPMAPDAPPRVIACWQLHTPTAPSPALSCLY